MKPKNVKTKTMQNPIDLDLINLLVDLVTSGAKKQQKEAAGDTNVMIRVNFYPERKSLLQRAYEWVKSKFKSKKKENA